ncbi:MAG: methyltransferase domain-containing protein [Anaerolineae bacterium]|nr:methyltransferase domain-containing protein [Anaerolineae bacterium]
MNSSTNWTNYILQLDDIPPLVHLWEQELVAELRQLIPQQRNLSVLEIGCSNGRWLRWFEQEYGATTFGIDLNAAGGVLVNNFVWGDGLRLPIADGTFDIVCSLGLVEHFATPHLRRTLIAEHVRVAKPQTGLVWLEHPNMNFSLSWLWTKYYYDGKLGIRHYRVTDREMRQHFQSLGVEILTTRFLDWFPGYMVKIVDAKLHKHWPWLPRIPEGIWQRKWFEHSLTADDFLIIGRRNKVKDIAK